MRLIHCARNLPQSGGVLPGRHYQATTIRLTRARRESIASPERHQGDRRWSRVSSVQHAPRALSRQSSPEVRRRSAPHHSKCERRSPRRQQSRTCGTAWRSHRGCSPRDPGCQGRVPPPRIALPRCPVNGGLTARRLRLDKSFAAAGPGQSSIMWK